MVPMVGPKFVPVMVMMPPIGPDEGVTLAILGGGVTLKATPLLATPPTVTTTLPVVAPVGTSTSMLVALQLLAVPAETPLNVTVLLPCGVPKFEPVTVIFAPTGP